MLVGLDARRVEDFGSEVAAENTPGGAVGGRADVVLIAAYDSTSGESGRTVGEECAVMDQGLVGQGVIGDED